MGRLKGWEKRHKKRLNRTYKGDKEKMAQCQVEGEVISRMEDALAGFQRPSLGSMINEFILDSLHDEPKKAG